MRRIIETGLPKPTAPFTWAMETNGTLYSAHVPIRPDGSIETGDATRQTEVALDHLRATLKAAGATPADVTMVQIFLTSLDHKAAVDAAYRNFFHELRACVAVSALPTPGTMIEMVVTAVLRR